MENQKHSRSCSQPFSLCSHLCVLLATAAHVQCNECEPDIAYYSVPQSRSFVRKQRKAHNRWRKSEQLLKPHQCAKCGTQYESENRVMIQHSENCNHTTAVLMSLALLLLQEFPGNSPTTVKEDSESKKKLEQRTQERRQQFNIMTL